MYSMYVFMYVCVDMCMYGKCVFLNECMYVYECVSGSEIPKTSYADFVGKDSFMFSLVDSFGRESVPGIHIHTYCTYAEQLCICIHTFIHRYIHTHKYMHTYIHRYIHSYAYIHTYIHTYRFLQYKC